MWIVFHIIRFSLVAVLPRSWIFLQHLLTPLDMGVKIMAQVDTIKCTIGHINRIRKLEQFSATRIVAKFGQLFFGHQFIVRRKELKRVFCTRIKILFVLHISSRHIGQYISRTWHFARFRRSHFAWRTESNQHSDQNKQLYHISLAKIELCVHNFQPRLDFF